MLGWGFDRIMTIILMITLILLCAALEKSSKLPGPSSYTTAKAEPQVLSSAAKHSLARRCQLPKPKPLGPGPGNYLLGSFLCKKGCKISSRPADRKIEITPGASAYVDARDQFEGPKYSMVGRSLSPTEELRGLPPPPTRYSVPS
eukprot:Sdes_comp11734_c0_seq1m2828